MYKNLLKITAILLLVPGLVSAKARKVDDFQWEGVERVVAIGDIHGDYDGYMTTLRAAGLVDDRGRWAGGETHLVQVGDLPDRGPDTLKIIEHIQALTKQARRKGGRVHSLIGNHEVMNVIGDLRYVHPGEYEAFVSRKSERLREIYYERYMERIRNEDPNAYAALPENFRSDWEESHPLGWLEHRQAWDPRWNGDAELAEWVSGLKVAIRVNDSLFVHGGISAAYCDNSLESLTEKAVEKLAAYDPSDAGILEDATGPFWYRGLSGMGRPASPETVDAILARHGVARVVVGHTPTFGVIWPEFDGKSVVIDTGISQYYGGYPAWLEIGPDGAVAGYPAGRLPLPSDDAGRIPYLEQVIEMDPENPNLKKRLERLLSPPTAEEAEEKDDAPEIICGSS